MLETEDVDGGTTLGRSISCLGACWRLELLTALNWGIVKFCPHTSILSYIGNQEDTLEPCAASHARSLSAAEEGSLCQSTHSIFGRAHLQGIHRCLFTEAHQFILS